MISPEEIIKERAEEIKPILEAIKIILKEEWNNNQEFAIGFFKIKGVIPRVFDKDFNKKAEEYALRKMKRDPSFDQEEFDSLSPLRKKISLLGGILEFSEKFYEEKVHGKIYDCFKDDRISFNPIISEIIKKEFEKYGWNVSFKTDDNEMYLTFTTQQAIDL